MRPTVSRSRRRGGGTSGGGDSLLAFLPSGMTLHGDASFDSPFAGTTAIDGFYEANNSAGGMTRVEDSSGGYGPWVAQFAYPEGSLGGATGIGGTGAGTLISALASNPLGYTRLYWAARHFFSSNYVAHSNRSGGEKLWYPTWTGVTLGQAPYINFVGAVTTCTPPFAIVTLDWSNWTVENPQIDTILLTDYVVPAGEWFDLAIDYTIGDPLTPNTRVKIWLNGTVVCDRTDINAYRGDPGITVNAFRYDSTRGGGDSNVPVPAGGMFRRLDRMVLYGSTT